MITNEQYQLLKSQFDAQCVKLVAVSKGQTVSAIKTIYEYGQRSFGENYVQELVKKQAQLPDTIEWHMLGHLQRNKVKQIVPFIHTIQSVDSVALLKEIDRQAKKVNRMVNCLFQIKISSVSTKFGFEAEELVVLHAQHAFETLQQVRFSGVMGIASQTTDQSQIKNEFQLLHQTFAQLKQNYYTQVESFKECSMGMSQDYKLAITSGSTMVRIGSLLFGQRVV